MANTLYTVAIAFELAIDLVVINGFVDGSHAGVFMSTYTC